jgi:hypothetical protein
MVKITEEGLKRLAIFADMNLFAILHPPADMPAEYIEKCKEYFLTVHYYFVQLTLDALEDKKFAEWLAPIFKRLDGQMIAYSNTLGILCDILQLKHRIDGELPPPPPADKIRKNAEYYMEKELESNETLYEHEVIKRIMKRKPEKEDEENEEVENEKEENVMFR